MELNIGCFSLEEKNQNKNLYLKGKVKINKTCMFIYGLVQLTRVEA
jgi:hypothetical protein